MSTLPPLDPIDEHCLELAKVDYTNFTISICLLAGILISYIPQHLRIINRRSSFGLSPYFVLLGMTSGTCAFANILTLPDSRADAACCRRVNGFACFAGLLGIAQVGMQWTCFAFILVLFLVFFPRATTPAPDATKIIEEEQPSFRAALLVTAVCIIHAVVIAAISLVFIEAQPRHLQGWANFLGIFSTVLASIQYFPQIWTTYTLRRVGSLSIATMCIQTPGSFVWATSLAARFGTAGWSAWGVYVVTGILQGTLLIMGIYFELMHKRQLKKELQNRVADANMNSDIDGAADERSTEETPLLHG